MCRRSFAGKPRRPEREEFDVSKGTLQRALFFVVQGSAGMLAASIAALPLKTRDTLSHCGFECCDVRAGVGNHFTEAGMQFACAGGAGYFCNVAWMKSAAGENRDAVSRLMD